MNPPNHLAREKSPYLQQHARNPVDWYPWGEEAFSRAAGEDRPVFLSVGYATCHWCHVMARESFEDKEIARLLNRDYIAVKVDREERPDIDAVYMAACQQMTGQGGWPLTIIMTPDKKPFFAGTYFPPRTRAGMTGLAGILGEVTRLWKEDRDRLVRSAGALTEVLNELSGTPYGDKADRSLLRAGYDELVASFDPVNGGFGRAPKFPTPAKLLFLLRFHRRTGEEYALRMAEHTLDRMSAGGIRDQLGGGFHRYSTDGQWLVPHFEKMLYDQALLLMAYTEAWQVTRKPGYRATAGAIITYVLRDLATPEGAFISAEDADSPGGEGAFYLWTRKELDEVLGPGDGEYAAALFRVQDGGNFSSPESGPGTNILHRDPETVGQAGEEARSAAIQEKLLGARGKRPRPARDGKVLADWNGLMISALALASRAFDEPRYCRAARKAIRFVLDRMRTTDGGLLHRWYDGEAAIPAFADDYGFVIGALIDLYGTDFDPAWLEEALLLNTFFVRHFPDPAGTGYFTSSDDGEALIARNKEIYDGAIPSANSVALRNLVLLSHLTGDPRHEEAASRLADGFAGTARCSPSAYCAYLCGLDHLLGPASGVVIAGEPDDPVAVAMLRELRARYRPSLTVHFRCRKAVQVLDRIAPFTRAMAVAGGKTAAYVCTGRACSAPVTTPEALRDLLEKEDVRGS
jgi:uncharacterized protein YyaL (SSP411 family)